MVVQRQARRLLTSMRRLVRLVPLLLAAGQCAPVKRGPMEGLARLSEAVTTKSTKEKESSARKGRPTCNVRAYVRDILESSLQKCRAIESRNSYRVNAVDSMGSLLFRSALLRPLAALSPHVK